MGQSSVILINTVIKNQLDSLHMYVIEFVDLPMLMHVKNLVCISMCVLLLLIILFSCVHSTLIVIS